MEKINFTLFFFLCLPLLTFSQNKSFIEENERKYIRQGIQEQKDEQQFLRVKIVYKDTTIYLYPNTVTSYGDPLGKLYKSFEIVVNEKNENYFLRHHYQGPKGSIFYCIDSNFDTRIFYFHSELIELNNNPNSDNYYKNILSNIVSDCEFKKEIIDLSRYSYQSIARSIDAIGACKHFFKPKPKLILSAGYSPFLKLTSKNDVNLQPIIPNSFLINRDGYQDQRISFASIGYQIPINRSIVSIVPTIRYIDTQTSFRSSSIFNIYRMDYQIQSLELISYVKLSAARVHFQPSISISPVIGIPIKKNIDMFASVISPINGEETRESQLYNELTFQIGYEIKLELEHQISERSGIGIFGNFTHLFQQGSASTQFDSYRIGTGLLFFLMF